MNKTEYQRYPDGAKVEFTSEALEAGKARPGYAPLRAPANGFKATYTIQNTDDSLHDVVLKETGERYGTYWLQPSLA